jgi:4-methylaminobutanoate oxidase (formaldehyde-forming)
MYGHSLGAAVGLGYVSVPQSDPAAIGADDYDIEVAGIRYPATASLRPMYDPRNECIRR